MHFLLLGNINSLRALRVASEIPKNLISNITACDLSVTSQILFQKNRELNNLSQDNRLKHVLEDANNLMLKSYGECSYSVIDLDPYGSAVPFLYSALKGIANNGLLCITCTDTRVLCGADRHKCFYLYGSVRNGGYTIEETALRILMATISRMAAQFGKTIKPLLSLQNDFYIRVFVQVKEDRKGCWELMNSHGIELFNEEGLSIFHRFGVTKEGKKNPSPQSLPENSSQKNISKLIRWTFMA